MAKFYFSDKWRKRTITALSLSLVATLSLGVMTACTTEPDDDDDDNTSVSATDTQLLRNGNFEFYADRDEKFEDKRVLISSPNSWSFTAGAPSSDTSSGIVNTEEWNQISATGGYSFTEYEKDGKTVKTFKDLAEAKAHWTDSNVSVYDRLQFLSVYEDDLDDLEKEDSENEYVKFFDDYNYAIDFEDVENLNEVDLTLSDNDDREDGENHVLMIHNQRTNNDVVGTGQYYTSSTTISLNAGTAAQLSVWVRTDKLTHYYDNDGDPLPVSQRAGAYIGVNNTVGGTSLDRMEIKNINTNGEWQEYTLYVRASTFASTSFSIVLGLGQGSSSDRYEYVNGYAFFDDVSCKLISAEDYLDATQTETGGDENGVLSCNVNSLKEDKLFDMDKIDYSVNHTFALDLYAGFDADNALLNGINDNIGLTEQTSGSITYTSESIHASLGKSADDYTALASMSGLASAANGNSYLKRIYDNDLENKYPFGDNGDILMLLSAHGAAYTAKSNSFTVPADSRMLVSFFVKTSDIADGLNGASATLVDGTNRTSLGTINSHNVSATDIDDERKDIYQGWVQCFFFLENATSEAKTCSIEFTYGPTTIVGTSRYSFAEGYAAFTNLETKTLSKTEYSYATTGDRAVKVSLTGRSENTSNFDEVSATAGTAIETTLATPANFTGVLGGSKWIVPGEIANEKPENVYAGLLNADYKNAYFGSSEAWRNVLPTYGATNGTEWWNSLFGNANQPLVIATGSGNAASYGYMSESLTLSASSTRVITMRVKVSAGATAYIYLTDTSSAAKSGNTLTTTLPDVTYWYNDNGDICASDPTEHGFNEEEGILFELQENGLYKRVGDNSDTYYANLYNYERDDDDNYVTSNGTIAYFVKDGQAYAYYDEEKDEYSCPVTCLPDSVGGTSILRYDNRNVTKPESVIAVQGSDKNEWVTVSFYLSTGNQAKNYRLEVWSGDRFGNNTNPAGSYVIFDNYNNATASNFSTLLNEAVDSLKSANGIAKDENLPAELAHYYTFTFYDSVNYLRYDVNEDEDNLGNPHGSYTQSNYSESIVYLLYEDLDGKLTGTGAPSHSVFLNYSVADVTVTEDDLGSADDDEDDDHDHDENETNVALLITSGIVAGILLLVILIIAIRRLVSFLKKRKQSAKATKAAKVSYARSNKPVKAEKKTTETKRDENDPYNN